jgi:phosphatidylserine/phosphatidylglycerophosphate/cardiolipin synthase-like enzyme
MPQQSDHAELRSLDLDSRERRAERDALIRRQSEQDERIVAAMLQRADRGAELET